MATFARSVRYVNAHLTELLPEPFILQAAREAGHHWRERKLGPVQIVLLLIAQILSANASLAQLRAVDGYRTSISALAQARSRLPILLLQHLLSRLLDRFVAAGPRVLKVDCSNTYTQDTPALRKRYRHPRQQRSPGDYPQLRSICLFDLISGLLIGEHVFSSDRQESPQLKHVLPLLRPGDIVIFDRGFVSYANFCMLQSHGVQGIARLSKTMWARRGSRHIRQRRLGKNDALVQWRKPIRRTCGITQKQWMQTADSLQLRQITLSVSGRHGRSRRIRLITTLLDPATHSLRQIGEFYRRRWEIETDFRHLKQTLGLEILRTQSPSNVRRELLVRAIAYNLVRIVMLQAASVKKTTCDRISFADACRWLLLPLENVPLSKLLTNPRRQRPSRPRKLKYRGKNYRRLKHWPSQAKELN